MKSFLFGLSSVKRSTQNRPNFLIVPKIVNFLPIELKFEDHLHIRLLFLFEIEPVNTIRAQLHETKWWSWALMIFTDSIADMPTPEDKPALQHLLGMVKYQAI